MEGNERSRPSWMRWMVCGLLGVLMPVASLADDGPVVCIDLQTSSTPSPDTITATYTGSGPTLYAFLVINGEVEFDIAGVVTGFALSGTGVENIGFTYLDGWEMAAEEHYGMSPLPEGPGSETPVAIGYWTLSLTNGGLSSATMSLVPPGGVNGSVVFVVDTDRRAHTACTVRHAGINTSAPSQTIETTVDEFVGQPPYHILTMYRGDAIQFPDGLVGAPLDAITDVDSALLDVLDDYAPMQIDKVFPARTPADSIIVTPTGQYIRSPALWRIVKLTIGDSLDVADLLDDLNLPDLITYAETNEVAEPAILEPDDDHYEDAWHLNNTGQSGGITNADINAPEAWDTTTGSSDVVVCIVDSGIDRDHPDFTTRTVVGDTEFGDLHGTKVAGVIGAATDNTIGVSGVDWNCTLMSQFTDYSAEETATAIDEAVDAGADIMVLAIRYSTEQETVRRALHRVSRRHRGQKGRHRCSTR